MWALKQPWQWEAVPGRHNRKLARNSLQNRPYIVLTRLTPEHCQIR